MINKVLLIDDNAATNFIHKKFIVEANCTKEVLDFQMGQKALDYLSLETNSFPDLIFIDINMPTMDAWEFLEEFKTLKHPNKLDAKIILLTTSISPQDQQNISQQTNVVDVMLKPLDPLTIENVMVKYFSQTRA